MNLDSVLLPLARIPWALVGALIVAWMGFDYYQFQSSSDSELNMEKSRIVELRDEVTRKTSKLQEVEQFRRTVDQRKQRLTEMMASLNERKLAVSDQFDAAEFVDLVSKEARRVGLDVIRLEPQSSLLKELYAEHPFRLAFRGVYVQFLVFLERIAGLQKIVRVDDFEVSPSIAAQASKALVELEARMELKVFRYVASEADKLPADLSAKDRTSPTSSAAPAAGVGTSAQPPQSEGGSPSQGGGAQ